MVLVRTSHEGIEQGALMDRDKDIGIEVEAGGLWQEE